MTRKQRQIAISYIATGASVVGAIGLTLFGLRPKIAMGMANRVIELVDGGIFGQASPMQFDAVSLKRKLTPYGDLTHMPYGDDGEVALELSHLPDEIPATLYSSIANWERLESKISLKQISAPIPESAERHVIVRARVEKPKSSTAKTGWSEPVIVWVGPKRRS
jgi:hypothetical protein